MFKPDPKFKNEVKAEWTGSKASGYRQMSGKSFASKTNKSKYGNIRTEYNGIKYDSIFEAETAQELDWLLQAKEIKEWKRQIRVPLKVNGVFIATYIVDFLYIDKHDQRIYLEAKGFPTEVFKMKWKIFMATLNEFDPGAEAIIKKQTSKKYIKKISKR